MDLFEIGLHAYVAFSILYFVGVNMTYVVLLYRSFGEVLHAVRQARFTDFRIIVQSEITPPVSILAPAYNEKAGIVESVRSLLKLSYGEYEVVVVNDGSKDETLDTLIGHFDLVRSRRAYQASIPTRPVRGIYRSKNAAYRNLTVVDKENGGKADALNAGINVARYEYVCCVDADSILEDDALQKVMKPFLDDPTVVASGGIVRIANGCEVVNGRVVRVGLSSHLLPLFQVVEYFRAFLSGRMGWQSLNALLIISGAFGMFRRQAVIEVGGYDSGTVGEDMELVVRMHRHFRDARKPYQITFVPDPVCWTEAPESLRVLGSQRDRWHRGLADTLWIHRDMVFNERYGVVGTVALPYFLIVELFGPVIEALGYVSLLVLLALDRVDPVMTGLFVIAAIVYGVMFSVGAVLLEEISFRRYPNPKHLAVLLVMGVLENFGYRQITVFWRLRGFWKYVRGEKAWGKMERAGFRQPRGATE
ncbi:MAG: glycosyltransferase family 2 protein [Bacteroidetes bacterium]|nr:glycosyltransferase family 2 protein [Bacteroidota bacterium]